MPLDSNGLALCAIVTVGMQLSMFFIAATFKFDYLTDITGSLNFFALLMLTFLQTNTFFTRQCVILALVATWSLRLGSFLLYRVLKRGRDERFDQIRENFFSFLGFWVFQMIWVFVVSLPVIFIETSTNDVNIGANDVAGWVIWGIGFLFEAMADWTKHLHYTNAATRGTYLSSNVWSVCRHPNYFGEICCWLGIFVSSTSLFSANTQVAWVGILSPALTAVLLLFVSGIPLAEQRYDEKFGTQSDYLLYKQSTSPVIPFPPSLYVQLPHVVKKWLFLELDM